MENIDSDLIRGNIDTIILKTMLDGDKYGLDIIKEVEQRSNGTYELKQPTLYSCLKRLENQELISSYWLDSDIGGKRHYYKLTEKGHDQLTKKQEEWSRSKFIIDNLLSNHNVDDYRLVSKEDYEKIIEGKQFVYQAPTESQRQSENQPVETSASTNSTELTDAAAATDATKAESFELNSHETTEPEPTELETEPAETLSDEAQAEENLSDDMAKTTDMVYVATESPTENEHATPTKTEATEQAETLRSFENNILASLRRQEDEEINTYVGDKTSYINQLRSSEIKILPEQNFEPEQTEYKVVQENLLDASAQTSGNELENHLNNFSESVSQLNKFLSRSDEPETVEEAPAAQVEEQAEEYDSPSTNFEVSEPEPPQNEEPAYNNAFERTRYASDTLSPQDDDYLDDLELLKSNNDSGYFASNDDEEYYQNAFENRKFASQTTERAADKNEFSENLQTSDFDYSANEDTFEENSNFESENAAESQDFVEPATDFSQFNDIISQSVNDYTVQSNMFSDNDFSNFEPPHKVESYKTKLSNLNEYAKNSEEKSEPKPSNQNSMNFAELKTEFEKEGIEIKQFKKYYRSDEAVKSYLLINKINLVSSLILFFGFLFILSAVYVILRNTDYGKSFDLSYKYFLIGMIPFAAYMLFYLLLFVINPYRKVSARYAPRIMLFISIIITVQLLLIIYCVNLQLGFYSFTQANYNHLIWIIPAIISLAPIVNNLVYMSLYYSKNFNV